MNLNRELYLAAMSLRREVSYIRKKYLEIEMREKYLEECRVKFNELRRRGVVNLPTRTKNDGDCLQRRLSIHIRKKLVLAKIKARAILENGNTAFTQD